MRVWISYLIDCLEAYAPEYTFDISEKAAPKVSYMRGFGTEAQKLRANTIYVCIDQVPGEGVAIPENTFFVLSETGEGAHLPNRIILHKAADQYEVANTILDAMDTYRRWLEQLIDLALNHGEPQSLVDASEEILKNPVLVQDPSYSLIAMSKSASVEDYPFFDFGGTLRPTPEFLFRMHRDQNIIRQYAAMEGDDKCVVAEQDGTYEIHCKIHCEGGVSINVTIAISRVGVTQGLLDLTREFCHYLRYSAHLTGEQVVPGSIANYAMEQVIHFGNPEAMRSLLNPRAGWQFVTSVFRLNEEEKTPVDYLLQMQEILPNSVVCIHNERLTAVFCISDRDSDAVYYQYQYEKLELLAQALDCIVGLSYPMSSLNGISDGLNQCRKALELSLPDQTGAQGRLCRYEDVAVADIVGGFFRGNVLEFFLPPEIAAVYRADREHHQNNCEILYHYLLSGKSLAATSAALHMHRSTIVYRLERMKENYNVRFDDPKRNHLYLICCLGCKLKDGNIAKKGGKLDKKAKNKKN